MDEGTRHLSALPQGGPGEVDTGDLEDKIFAAALDVRANPKRRFALLATFDHPHFTLVLADLSELTLARLDRSFDEPIANPGRPPHGPA